MYPFFLISLIYFQRYKKFNKKEIFSIFCISIYFFAVFISGERTSFFNFVLMNLILIIIFFKKIFLRYIILIPIIFFFFVSISYIQNKNTIERYLDVRNILTNKSIVFFSATHEKHYKSAYKIFLKNKTFGSGLKTFRNICKKPEFNPDGCTTHPHNIIMQFLSELD